MKLPRTVRHLFNLACAFILSGASSIASTTALTVHPRGTLSTRGLDVLVFNNAYDGLFSDAKISGIELIHHDVRTVTNGDVRLSPTPGQWNPAPELRERKVDAASGTIEALMAYAQHDFTYTVRATAHADGVLLSVILDSPLPAALEGRAGFNLEFLPAAYFARAYLADGDSGTFPLHPAGPMERDPRTGVFEPAPLATGHTLVLAPEDPAHRVSIEARSGSLALYDGRNQAQNGWFVVRSLLPAGKTGAVLEWFLQASTIPGWTRPTVIAHSQTGYHPLQRKIAVLETDEAAPAPPGVRLVRLNADGTRTETLAAAPHRWGGYLRYVYYTFDFSAVAEPGLYQLECGDVRTKSFRIAGDVLARAWQPSIDIYLPVQMDHMFVNEAYRVWHGLSHMDDARQAPPDHVHFDLYAQGPSTDSPFQAGEHIPGLNIGGWYDAGDFDIRTQTQYSLVENLASLWETFRPERDNTTIDQAARHVEIHQPDGVPDILQQIEHGTLALLAQHRVFGHAIPGIIAPTLEQYTHLGDGASKTDGRIYDPAMGPLENDGRRSGVPDDRWAFTTHTSALNYGSAAALAAASRALRGWRDALADECIETALRVWKQEQSSEPATFRHGNTTGGPLEIEELRAATQLLITTGDASYAKRINELWPAIDRFFPFAAQHALRALPHMDADFAARLRGRAIAFRDERAKMTADNPFGVPITQGGWAGNGAVAGFALGNWHLHKAYPDLFDPGPTFRGLEYLHGCHPGSDISFVSGVGTHSKTVAYGSNRADFSFIAGGVVPGVLIVKPDFPENKEDWPFFWGENEYVVNLAGSYVFLVHAAQDLLEKLAAPEAPAVAGTAVLVPAGENTSPPAESLPEE